MTISQIPQAVCAFLYDCTTDMVVLVTRRNSTQVGLPGGKVDPGESLIEAMTRELKEETSIDITFRAWQAAYTAICYGKDGNDFDTTTFFVPFQGELPSTSVEDGINIRWGKIEELLTNSPFVDYNMGVIETHKELLFNIL